MQTLAGSPSISGKTVTLTLQTAVSHTDTGVTVSYARPTSVASMIKDLAANPAASFANREVTNLTASNDTTAPTVVSIVRHSPTAERTNADRITWRVTFSEPVRDVNSGDFNIRGRPSNTTLYGMPVSGSNGSQFDIGVRPASSVSNGLEDHDGTLTLSFKSGQDIEDLSGNALANTTPTGANGNTYILDNTPPVFESADVSGSTLAIEFSEALDGGQAPAAGAFDVRVAGSLQSVLRFAVSGRYVNLQLSPGADFGDTVTVAYNRPGSGDVLRDVAGNEVASFGAQTVTNFTPSTDPDVPRVLWAKFSRGVDGGYNLHGIYLKFSRPLAWDARGRKPANLCEHLEERLHRLSE